MRSAAIPFQQGNFQNLKRCKFHANCFLIIYVQSGAEELAVRKGIVNVQQFFFILFPERYIIHEKTRPKAQLAGKCPKRVKL